jgi:predicted HicB family RNase H-like nuclease
MSLNSIIEYKGYLAELTLDINDNIVVGRVINTADIISFHGKTVEEAKLAFHDLLDTYLSTCQEENIEPSLPCSGRFSLRVSPVLHEKLRYYAKMKHQSLNDFIVNLLEQDIESLVSVHGAGNF